MSGKRRAKSDLNHDNWDQDEQPEEAGTFKRASEDALKARTIKSAKRRSAFNSSETVVNPFGGFSGFTKSKDEPFKTQSTQPIFQFSSNKNLLTNGGTTPNEKEKGKESFQDKDKSFFAKLKGLNENVSLWIKKHVDSNPYLDLQPVFRDYEKYFSELQKERSSNNTQNETFNKCIFNAPTDKKDSTMQFPLKKDLETQFTTKPVDSKTKENFMSKISENKDQNKTEPSTNFSFGTKPSLPSFGAPLDGKPAPTLGFSFGSSQSSMSTASTFSFSAPTNTNSSTTQSNDANKDEDAEDEPPVVEFTPVVEKDFVYTKRCKVFVKKDGNFADRGVGNLYLKPIDNSEKYQFIVRADTNLGNLLCNFILSESIPLQRLGKKDVMLVSIPTPDEKPPPVPMLIRVKSPEDADELLSTLEKYKK